MVEKKKATKKISATDARSTSNVEVPEDGIGDRLREAREALGLTQIALASRTKLVDKKGEGISRTVIVGYEAGTYKPGARELRILCETLNVTPNWLLYRKEAPFETTLSSLHFMRGPSELAPAIRLAIATLLLKPHERDMIAGLVLSLGGRSLGDARLAGLMALASVISQEIEPRLLELAPEGTDPRTLRMEALVDHLSEQMTTNWGNKVKYSEDGAPVGGEWIYPDPKAAKS